MESQTAGLIETMHGIRVPAFIEARHARLHLADELR